MTSLHQTVEEFLDRSSLKYFARHSEECYAYVLFFTLGKGFFIQVDSDEQNLLFRSLPLLDLDFFAPSIRHRLTESLMSRSDQLMLGAYVGDRHIRFEYGVAVMDGTVTQSQLKRYVDVVAGELCWFDDWLDTELLDVQPNAGPTHSSPESISPIIRRMLGDGPSLN